MHVAEDMVHWLDSLQHLILKNLAAVPSWPINWLIFKRIQDVFGWRVSDQDFSVTWNFSKELLSIGLFALKCPMFYGYNIRRSKEFVAKKFERLVLKIVTVGYTFQPLFENFRILFLLQYMQPFLKVLLFHQFLLFLLEDILIECQLMVPCYNNLVLVLLAGEPLRKLNHLIIFATHRKISGMNEQVTLAQIKLIRLIMRI